MYVVPCDTVYVNVIDTVYVDIINWFPEYVDCETFLPCNNSAIQELINKSEQNNKLYNLLGYEIKKPKGVYIENGQIKYKLN